MRSVTVRLDDLRTMILNLGFVGENEHRKFNFDCKKMFGEYPSASVSLTVQPPAGDCYPATVERDGDLVSWTVTDSDLIEEGCGEIQLTFMVGEVVAKTCIGRTKVERSLGATGDIPTPIENWIEQAEEVISEAEAATAAAEGAAEHQPIIDDNGYWAVWDADAEEYVATEYKAQGTDGHDGVGIVSIEKTGTSGLVDTYTITFTSGNPVTYTVTNGRDSDPAEIIDDNAGAGDTDKVWSADKSHELLTAINSKADIERIETNKQYNHSNLITPTKITFIGDGKAFGNMKFADVKNATPSLGSRTSSSKNVTYVQDGYFLHLDGTCSANGGNAFLQNAPIESIPVGNYKLIVLTDIGESQLGTNYVEIYYSVGGKTVNKYVTKAEHEFAFTTTGVGDKVSINVAVKSGNVYSGFTMWFGLFPSSATIVDVELPVAEGGEYDYVLDNDYSAISTLMHPSKVETGIGTNNLILLQIAKKSTFVTPEEFGAVGDGGTDDYNAIAQAITEGVQSGRLVVCAKKYVTSQTIIIGSNTNVIINEITYTGQNEAVKIQGRNNNIQVKQITSSGVGIVFKSDTTTSVRDNNLEIGKLTSAANGIELTVINTSIFNNKISFVDITAGGNNYYCIKGDATLRENLNAYLTENTIRGGHCSNAYYAVYGVGGNSRLENLYIEDNIKGGFYNCRNAQIIYDRHWECCFASDEPFIKFTLDPNAESGDSASAFRYIGTINLPLNKIDVSGVGKTYAGGTQTIRSSDTMGVIDCPIGAYVSSDGIGTAVNENPISERAYVFADAVILVPMKELVAEITDDFDMRTFTKTSKPFPTTFVVDAATVNIYLHSSYCWIGYSKFVVSQKNGYKAKVYEWFGDRCVFDGTGLGDGDYEVECYTESRYVFADGTNMKWRYRKLTDTYTVVV